MNIQRSLSRLLGALLLAATPGVALAAPVTTPDNGDVFLGVRATGGQGLAVSLLINVGDESTFLNATAGTSLQVANVGAELAAVYGPNWSTRADLNWAFFGARNQTNPVVYSTRAQSPAGLPASSYPAQDLSQRTATKNQIISVVDAYSQLDAYNGNPAAALQTNELKTSSYNAQVGTAGTTDFGSLSEWTTIEGGFGAGAAGSVLDFFRYGGTAVTPAAERLGSFEITSAGALTFTRSLPAGVAGIRLAATSFEVDEDAGVATLVFRRTDDVSNAVSATFSTTNGTALSGTDYTAQTNVTVSFAAGEYEKTVQVPVVDRPGLGSSRQFTVTLANASGGAQLVTPGSATVTILDTDSVVQFAAATTQVRAMDVLAQPNVVEVLVSRTGDLREGATVSAVISAGGTLVNGTHYVFTSPTTLTFAPNDAEEIVTIPLESISANLLPGTILLALQTPVGSDLGSLATATVNVLPNSGEIAFDSAITSVNAVTPGGAPNQVNVLLRRVNGAVGPASVNVTATGGTLTSGVHYVALATPTTVTFATGVETASFAIQLNAIATTLLSSGATIELALSSPTNSATLGALSTATVSVFGTPGAISLGALVYNVREEAGVFQLPLVRTGGTSGAVSVTVNTAPGTATSPADFTAVVNQVVTFADGVSTALLPIAIANTVPNEANETFTVSISAPGGGAALGVTTTATLRILDTDTAAPTLTLTAPKTGVKISAPNSAVTITGTAKDNKEVASILVQFNGGAPVSVPFTADGKGGVGFNYGVTAQRGTNIVVLSAFDHRGNAAKQVTATFIYDDPFTALAGTYVGLALSSGGTARSHSNNGLVAVQVQGTGSFSGRLTIDGLVLPFTGFIGDNGTARFGATGSDKVRVERPNKPGFEIAFSLDLSTTPGVKRVSGSITEYRRSVVAGTATFAAERPGFGKSASVPASYLVNKGAYTLVLPTQPQSSEFTSVDFPQGDGVGTATVRADGTVTLAGTLADGTKFTASSLLWVDLRLPLYTELYNKAGSLGGILAFNDALEASDFKGDSLFWFRPFLNVQHYPYGWPEGLDTVLLGAKYAVPPSTSALGALPAANPTLGNAVLEFTDGLLSGVVLKAVNLDAKDKVTNAPVSDKSFSLAVTQGTGLFSGKFLHTDGTQPSFTGVIYQKGSQRGGYGHFLSTTPKVRDGAGGAGAVTLTPRL